jgi:hypothetical protein
MIQARHQARFLDKALKEGWLARQMRVDQIDGHISLQRKIASQINGAHAPFSQQTDDTETAKHFPDETHCVTSFVLTSYHAISRVYVA